MAANVPAALPHSEVEVREFYKYIEQSLPEPRRMKQLLTWCGSRALPEKPSGAVKDANVIMAGEFHSIDKAQFANILTLMQRARYSKSSLKILHRNQSCPTGSAE